MKWHLTTYHECQQLQLIIDGVSGTIVTITGPVKKKENLWNDLKNLNDDLNELLNIFDVFFTVNKK